MYFNHYTVSNTTIVTTIPIKKLRQKYKRGKKREFLIRLVETSISKKNEAATTLAE